ncbi:hypothetical protein DVH24_014128 [Malus domestica]|uniref:Uncharacterized protein n=1 Tax=Malus domestica TaxID=3750 RepID=A0A498JIP0_MALDO|nr:hypothetical protein DVH24_014128 [Malus domestica]
MRKRGLAIPGFNKTWYILFLFSYLYFTLDAFEKEQVVGWRGNDYKPPEDGYFQIENCLIVQNVIWVMVQRHLISQNQMATTQIEVVQSILEIVFRDWQPSTL